jgi:hypothetical protein
MVGCIQLMVPSGPQVPEWCLCTSLM